ncbi:MAG: hypothetical protein NC180_09430 [Muribaculaceae bacterium]|nr:hypothetical protein [Roseburia sp.]MCM1431869.1 hypothetical protein [Muribaculaceae bacterium]MCM1493429.1 hypothetical protein [Muribaculaceae bacterium]
MKNLNYFPFERNHYYYGKLLGVEDFEAEQRYMNDKRRLINRFMHGCGVVCGLSVVQVAEDAVSVEAGLALDHAGREIMVDEPVTRRLAELPGFPGHVEGGEKNDYLYLCIEYAEYERDNAYNITGDGENAYNRTAEGYRLYLTAQEPGQELYGCAAYYGESKTVYWGNGVRIRQIFPRFVESGREFDVRIRVENMGQRQPVFFRYELELEGICRGELTSVLVEFDETKQERAKHYEFSLTLTAGKSKNLRACARVKENSFCLRVGEEEKTAGVSCESGVEICGEPVELTRRRYYAHAMQEIRQEAESQILCLAKISFIDAGDAVIDDVEEMPFGQYICSDMLLGLRELAAAEELKHMNRRMMESGREPKIRQRQLPANLPVRQAFGTAVISLGMGGLAGRRFYSSPIVHGLGPGNVTVVFGMGDRETPSAVYYGQPEVFGEFVCEVQAVLAAKVNVEAGTFVLGIKLTESTAAESVKIYWAAFCDGNQETVKEKKHTLFLKPDMVYLKPREDCRFAADMSDSGDRLEWSVAGKDSGSIDSDGHYTAPSAPGVYQILAKSRAHPKLSASAYAVVRDV